MKTIVQTDEAPRAIGTYSQAVKVGETVYISGQIPLVPETMALVSQDFLEQITQAFHNLQAVIHAAGGTTDNVAKLTIYLLDLTHFAKVNEVMAQFFNEPYPARAALGVAALPMGAQVEIDAILDLNE